MHLLRHIYLFIFTYIKRYRYINIQKNKTL